MAGASLVEAGKCPQETHLFIYLSSRWGRCEAYLRTRSNLDYVSAEVSTRYGILSIKVIDVMLEPGVLGNWDQLSGFTKQTSNPCCQKTKTEVLVHHPGKLSLIQCSR